MNGQTGPSLKRRTTPLTLAAAVLALTFGAAVAAPGVAAGGTGHGTCLAPKVGPSLPCTASDDQTYGAYTIPEGGDDTEPAVEAVLGHVLEEETDVTSVAHGLTGDTSEFDFTFPDPGNPNDTTFSFSYSGKAPLAFLTITTPRGFFAIYDIAKQTEATIDVGNQLGDFDPTHFSFWQRTFTECEPVRVEETHGKKMIPGCQLSEIVNGKVPCVHVEKARTANCRFNTGKKPSGQWLEGAQFGDKARYALANQAITRKGKKGGAWIVASKQQKDAGLPCRKVPPARKHRPFDADKRDTASVSADGSLAASGYTEVATATTNVSGTPLENYATRTVYTSTPPPHPDNAQLVSQPPPGASYPYGYTALGAALNDQYGVERYSPAAGGRYIDDPYHRHFIIYLGATVAAAKRPSTKPNGELLPGTKIAWRTVAPNAKIAN